MKIIIVEDEQRAREGLAKLITSLSSEYEVIGQAGNGQSALDMILKYQPDVIFTDIKMPIMDGITMTRMVRAHGIKSEFVVISAYGDFDMARQFISLGVAMRNSSPRNIPVLRATSRWICESFSFLTCGMHAPTIETMTRTSAYRTNVNSESIDSRSEGCY